MIDIEIKPCHKCICKNRRSPLKPSLYYGWCISLSNNPSIIGLTKFTNENNVVGILNHEIMHVVLYKLEGNKAYTKFDRLDNKEKSWFE